MKRPTRVIRSSSRVFTIAPSGANLDGRPVCIERNL